MRHTKLKEFYLLRNKDVSGVSGEGVVARGVILESGRCVLEFVNSVHTSINIYQNITDVELIHGHSGATEIIMGTPPKDLK